jgi:hypothetical protein
VEKHLHDRTISLRDELWAPKTTLTTPLYIDGTGCLNMKEVVISVETELEMNSIIYVFICEKQ